MKNIIAEPDFNGKHRRLVIFKSLSQNLNAKFEGLVEAILKEIILVKQKFEGFFNQPSNMMEKFTSTTEKVVLKQLKRQIFEFQKSVQILEFENSSNAIKMKVDVWMESISLIWQNTGIYRYLGDSWTQFGYSHLSSLKDEFINNTKDLKIKEKLNMKYAELKSHYDEKHNELELDLHLVKDGLAVIGIWNLDDTNSWKLERDFDHDFCNMMVMEFEDHVTETKLAMIDSIKMKVEQLKKQLEK